MGFFSKDIKKMDDLFVHTCATSTMPKTRSFGRCLR